MGGNAHSRVARREPFRRRRPHHAVRDAAGLRVEGAEGVLETRIGVQGVSKLRCRREAGGEKRGRRGGGHGG